MDFRVRRQQEDSSCSHPRQLQVDRLVAYAVTSNTCPIPVSLRLWQLNTCPIPVQYVYACPIPVQYQFNTFMTVQYLSNTCPIPVQYVYACSIPVQYQFNTFMTVQYLSNTCPIPVQYVYACSIPVQYQFNKGNKMEVARQSQLHPSTPCGVPISAHSGGDRHHFAGQAQAGAAEHHSQSDTRVPYSASS